MKLSIVRTDKKHVSHLTVKSFEWFLERIKTDTKAENIGKFRQYVARFGDNGIYEDNVPIAMIYPLVEMLKAENGNFEITAFNNLAWLHVGGLMKAEEIKAVKEASMILPTTFAAFMGADGKSVEILVSVAQKDAANAPQTEADMDAFCKAAYEVAFGAYSGVLPKPIERQGVTARSCFRMPLDESPCYNPQVTPMMVQMQRDDSSIAENPESEQRTSDYRLYEDYEMLCRHMEDISNRVFDKDNRTYLMGGAMTWIVFFHIYLWCSMSNISTPWWIELFDKGALGVDVFLLLSAYGLQCSIEHNTIKRFYKNRIKRLFPGCLLFLLVLFTTFEHLCPLEKILFQCICQISGISLFKYADFFSCGFCFDWFTPAIILLYITFPIVSKVVKWIEKKDSYYDYLVLVFLVIIGVWIRENKHFPFGLLAIRMPIIYLGILINLYLKHHKANRLLNISVVAACVGLVSGNEEMRLSLLVLPLLFSFSLTCFQLPIKSFFCLVGRHSYEIYLAHIFPVAFVIPLHYTSNIYLLTIITIIMTALMALLLSFVQSKFWSILDKFSYR